MDTDIELRERLERRLSSPRPSESSIGHGRDEDIDIPPVDKGRAAWLALVSCSFIQTPVWGFSLAFGVLQEYYTAQNTFQGNPSNIPVIGTSSTGILYLSSPVLFTLLTAWPWLLSWCSPIGWILTSVCFIASAFATQIWQAMLTQGVLLPISTAILFAPTTLALDSWFHERKGLAYGVMWAGKSATGVAIPFIVRGSLNRFGYRATFIGWGIFTLLTTGPLLPFLKPRPEPARESHGRQRLDTTFLRLPAFWMLQVGNTVQSLGYFLPFTYLASYAALLGLPPISGPLLLALVNLSSVPGGIVVGLLIDRIAPTTVIMLSAVGSACAVFLLWGLARQLAVLALFALSYGFFAGGFSSTWSGVVTELKRESPAMSTGLVFGLLAGARGVGNVISGPLSVALIEKG